MNYLRSHLIADLSWQMLHLHRASVSSAAPRADTVLAPEIVVRVCKLTALWLPNIPSV